MNTYKGLSEIGKKNELNLKRADLLNRYNNGEIREVSIDYIVPSKKEWNYFRELSEEKMSELILSIKQVGLINPIIVWDNGIGDNEGFYTCLSGHNRLSAYKKLYKITKDVKYENILTIIKSKDEIDENVAKQIIIDTNLAQRELSKIEKSKSIIKKFYLLKERKDELEIESFSKILEKEFGIKDRQIRRYKKLGDLNIEFQEMIDNGLITIETGCKIASLSKELQDSLHEEVLKDKNRLRILNKKSKNIKNHFTIFDIEKLFKEPEYKKDGIINISYLDNTNNKISAKLLYPKEDELHFIEMLNTIKKINDININYNILK